MAAEDTTIPDKLIFKDQMYVCVDMDRIEGTGCLSCYGTVFDRRTKEVSCWIASEEYRVCYCRTTNTLYKFT